jgi:DNA-binding transcriptional ArsR family regulator
MEIIDINKALANQTRLNILKWLKDPEANFRAHEDLGHFNDGVCVFHITERAGLSQSTISTYLIQMQKASLIIPTRHGKWTYYKRNEAVISEYIRALNNQL